jgi:hypothetical protein
MVKPPASSYAALSLDATPPQVAEAISVAAPVLRAPKEAPNQDASGKPEKGKPYVTYLHPRGHRALKLYALESDGSVQGIIIEALETWAKAHGVTEPMRPDRTK